MKTFLSPAFCRGRIYYPGVFVVLATLAISAWVIYPKVKAGNEKNKAEQVEQTKQARAASASGDPVSPDGTARH